MQDQNVTVRTLKLSAVLALCVTLCLFSGRHTELAWGFAVGALLSLISVFSLVVVIPQLLQPDGPRHAQALLAVTLFMKLPLYMVGLYILAGTPGVSPVAGAFGIALAPAVITAQAFRSIMPRRRLVPQPARTIQPAVAPPLPAVAGAPTVTAGSASQTPRPVPTGLVAH